MFSCLLLEFKDKRYMINWKLIKKKSSVANMEYVKFCENCTILMVPCFVPYDHYREEKAILKECKRDTHPVDAENETKF